MGQGKNGWVEEGKRQGLGWAVEQLRKMIAEGKDIKIATTILNNEYRGRVRRGSFPVLTEKELWDELKVEKLVVVGTMKAIALIAAWEAFDMKENDSRLNEFLTIYGRYVSNLDSDTFGWPDVFETLESEIGVTIDLKSELAVAERDGQKRRRWR